MDPVTHTHSPNVVAQHLSVSTADRERLMGQRGCVLWFTGLSGSGKSTLANALDSELHGRGIKTVLLDGDNVRHGLCGDLGFSADDRHENLRRIAEVAKLMADTGLVVLTAFVSPYRSDRDRARAIVGPERFAEIYVDAPVEVCATRDVKGLYAKAQAGLITDFTGVNSPYEAPLAPELTVASGSEPLTQSAAHVLQWFDAFTTRL
ncbi:MAG: adenylyl-sulfate kinase [Schleiferiaceae bacterium]|jgi:adenylylsulfate kinase|nr:adenylyl-sulfate kinase [Schleiferiaceae bacterium]MDP5014727.1 adenylyl-sulfate kinase [Schleiferiaceae bacterium]